MQLQLSNNNSTDANELKVFYGFGDVDQVRNRLAQLDREIDISRNIDDFYNPEYIKAAAALDYFEPAECARLLNKLKGKGVAVTRWEAAMRASARQERERIRESIMAAKAMTAASRVKTQPLGSGRPVTFDDPEPADHPVDGVLLADDLLRVITRFVVTTKSAKIASVLWIIATHLINEFDLFPRLALSSPVTRCGKSTLLNLLSQLVWRPLPLSNITPAAIYRCIEAAGPTLLMDEMDMYIKVGARKLADEMLGILNSGHTRRSAKVLRLVPGSFEVREFSTFTPIVHALIGDLPETLADRSIKIPMQRKLYPRKSKI